MAFYYSQGNIADRKDSLVEKTSLIDHSPRRGPVVSDNRRMDSRHHKQSDDLPPHHGLARNVHGTTTNNSGRRRERLGETLRMARQGVSRREATRLARIFGEATNPSEPPVADYSMSPATKHGGGGLRRQHNDSHHQIPSSEIIRSNLEPKELLLNSLGRVSYGTWKGLIIYLTSSHQNADDFVSKFMLSFRSFATPKDLAEALVARARNVAHADPRLQPSDLKLWHDRVQGPVQYTVFRVIQLWYTSYWNPAADDPLLTYLCAFILNEYLPSRHGSSAKECQKLLHSISLKNRYIDLRYLAASPGTSLLPLGLGRHSRGGPRSPVIDHLNILATTTSASNQHTTTSASNQHTTTAHSKHRHHDTKENSASRRGAGLSVQTVESSEVEDAILRTNTTDGTTAIRSEQQLNQVCLPKRRNFLRRLFSKQRNSRAISEHSSRSHAGANENNTDNESAATTTRDDGSTVSGVNTVDDNARLPPPSVRTVGGASAVGGKLSPAKERMLAELNSYIDTQDRRPAASTSSPSMRSSSEEGPDISDLLMATVGVDLSYQAYRQTSHITHVNPLDVACQLTIIESSCYCMIQPAELINKEFSRGCQSCSVNVRQMSRWCTQITRWVSVLILSEATPERRCRMLKYAIQLGTHLLALKNYDGVMAIKAAIFSAAVMRLKLSWSLLPKKFDIMSKRLHEAMDSERNFANYRAMLHRSQPPLLPFLGLYLTDLTFLDDGNPTYRRFVLPHEVSQLNPQQQLSNQTSHDDSEKPHHHPSSNVSNSDPPSKQAPPRPADTEPLPQSSSTPQQQTPPAVQLTGQTCALFAKRDDVDLNSRSILINFEKSYRVATIIQEFQKFQVEYSGNFTMAIPGLQQYLIEQWDRCEAEGYDDDKIYSLSLQCEPRAACPISSGGANGADASTGRMSHHQPVQTAMRLTRLLPGAAQRLRGRDLSDTTLPSI